jgi:hypothetical protein
MTAVASLGSLKIRITGGVTRAYDRASFSCDERVFAVEVSARRSRHRGIVVEIKPRTFTETANHFRLVTKAVDWPQDAPDID